MRYIYKCTQCDTEREVVHSVEECDYHTEICLADTDNKHLDCGGAMYRVMQSILTIWKGGKPSSL